MDLLTIRHLVMADTPFGRAARSARRFALDFTLPVPRVLAKPLLLVFLAIRQTYYFLYRTFLAEPIFKAYCAKVGKRVRTGPFIQWIQGGGRIEIGDDVKIHGKVSIAFSSRYADEPFFSIGSHSHIGHNCVFTIGKSVIIGDYCQMAPDVVIYDASGHASEPEARLRGEPAAPDSVKPVVIERNVWLGRGAVIMPGVTVGENSVIAARAVVTQSVPPNSFMLGNPARRMGSV
jgi:carbonic anhydrase/acetyltransferase-like protein (isoleucine patch superfamily)